MYGFNFQHLPIKEMPLFPQDVTDIIFLLPMFRIWNSLLRFPFIEISSKEESDQAPKYKNLVALLSPRLAKED